MTLPFGGRIPRFLLLAAGVLLTSVAPARAQDYVLGPEDVVSVSVWMHPELERTAAIGADSSLVLPPIGAVKAAGLTTKQLGDRIADRLSSYLRQTTTVTVSVAQYWSRSVYVSGAVARPGRIGFERIPSVVDVINQAGGAQTGADLGAVQILRKDAGERRTMNVDLGVALRTGETSGLPELKPGDTVVVPSAPSGAGSTSGEGVAVLGEVARPGVYVVLPGQDLWSVLAQSGGLTPRANLSNIRVLSRADGGQSVATINLKEILDRGSRAPTAVRQGDVIVVLAKGPNVWTGLNTVFSLSRDALNVAVLVDYFKTRNGN